MPRRSVLVILGFVQIQAVGWAVLPPAMAQRPVDRATEAMRREADLAEKVKRDVAARLKALPAAAVPAPRPVAFQGPIWIMRDAGRPPEVPRNVLGGVRQAMIVPLAGEPDADDLEGEATPQITVTFSRESLDLWVFGMGRAGSVHTRLEEKLSMAIDRAVEEYRITAAQQAKLWLAGRGDIKRFFDRVEKERGALGESDPVNMAPEQYEKLRAELLTLQSAYSAGLFGDGSLYEKTLRTILADRSTAGHRAR